MKTCPLIRVIQYEYEYCTTGGSIYYGSKLRQKWLKMELFSHLYSLPGYYFFYTHL